MKRVKKQKSKKKEKISYIRCFGCGLRLKRNKKLATSARFAASAECLALFHELSLYTLAEPREEFIHQHVIDTYTAQHTGKRTKPVMAFMATLGLYLYVERGWSGKKVQQAHVRAAKLIKEYPILISPHYKTEVTIADVIKDRSNDKHGLIRFWAGEVWNLWQDEQVKIRQIALKLFGE